ncbi:MAG: hypothetical protein SVY53_00285 [Chloroflexota bacterium]|nr:hypothetical protein [Chloroflexota bacterium]
MNKFRIILSLALIGCVLLGSFLVVGCGDDEAEPSEQSEQYNENDSSGQNDDSSNNGSGGENSNNSDDDSGDQNDDSSNNDSDGENSNNSDDDSGDQSDDDSNNNADGQNDDSGDDDELSDLLTKAGLIDVFQMEIVGTNYLESGEQTTTSRYWNKGSKSRIEGSYTHEDITYNTIAVHHMDEGEHGVSYNWQEGDDTAIKYVLDATEDEDITQYSPRFVGSEVVDGKACSIYEHPLDAGNTTNTVRTWIWKKNGLTIKIETRHEGELLSVMEFINIEVGGSISDSLFEVPSDMIIEDVSSYP